MNRKLVARMQVWFVFYVVAVLCGLNMFAHSTFFWVSVMTAIYVSKWRVK